MAPKVTVLEPWVLPKFEPVMVTMVPAVPEMGEIAIILGTLGGTAHPFCFVQG